MKNLLLIPIVLLFSCSAASQLALLQELRLDECEIGSVDITGHISTGPGFGFGSANININIQESRTAETLPASCPIDGE